METIKDEEINYIKHKLGERGKLLQVSIIIKFNLKIPKLLGSIWRSFQENSEKRSKKKEDLVTKKLQSSLTFRLRSARDTLITRV